MSVRRDIRRERGGRQSNDRIIAGLDLEAMAIEELRALRQRLQREIARREEGGDPVEDQGEDEA